MKCRGFLCLIICITECKYGVKGSQLGSSPGIGLVVSGCFDVDTPSYSICLPFCKSPEYYSFAPTNGTSTVR